MTATFSDDELARMVAGLQRGRAASTTARRSGCATRWSWAAGRCGTSCCRWSRVVYARVGVTPEELERLSAESGFSRFPVVDDGRRIVGYLHVKDALDADAARRCRSRSRHMRPIARVRETTPLDDVLTRDAAQSYASGGGAGRGRAARRGW